MKGRWLRAKGWMQSRAASLRRTQTGTEARLWAALRGRRLGGLKFRRQHPIDRYEVDFCCPSRGLVVEIDGDVQSGRESQDEGRTDLLELKGFHVIRFTNEDVLRNLDAVLEEIHDAAVRRLEA